jgi:preprotein translocase subunit SecG
MENVVLTIHLILALALIGIVLLQRSEGGALGMGGGGTGSMAARSQATGLTKLTWILAVCFIITSLTLTILATRSNDGGSVVDSVATEETAPAADAPATPGLTGNLLPPSATDAPATAPRADEPVDPAAPAAPAAPATNP